MSYSFSYAGDIVFDPALGVGTMFLGLAQGAAQVLGVPSGLNPRVDGTCAIDDRRTFVVFVEQLWERYFRTRHPIQRAQLHGLLLVCVGLLELIGAPITPADEAQAAFVEQARVLMPAQRSPGR